MNAEKKRQDIVDAGMKLFQQYGFEKVSVDDICRFLGISKPTLYKYVQKKEMILAYYYQQRSVDSLPKTYELLQQERPAAAMQYLFTTLHEIAQDMGPELYAAYRIYTMSDPDYLASYSRPQVRVLEVCLEALQALDQIANQADPHKLAVMLMDLNEGLSLTWASGGGLFELGKSFQNFAVSILGIKITPEEARRKARKEAAV